MTELEQKRLQDAFDTLYKEVLELYTNGILVQHGVSDELAVGIVSRLARKPIDEIKELKRVRDENLNKTMLHPENGNRFNNPAGVVEHAVQKP